MVNGTHWIQPEGIDGILPAQARIVEGLRRALLDLYHVWGYDLVIPPFLDYLPSLLSGSGQGLDQKTFKLVDPLSGQMVGIRADMTPQVARMDAHALGKDGPVRLCYMGTVLHTKPDGLGGARSLLQLGIELYGRQGVDSDIEVLALMLKTLAMAGIEQPHIDLGHVGVFRGLAVKAGLAADQEQQLYDALQRKSTLDIAVLVEAFGLSKIQAGWFQALANLNGDESVLSKAEAMFVGLGEDICGAIQHLKMMAERLKQRMPDLSLYFDLAELRGYEYHTGVVFAAFVPEHGQEIARGGRYDDIGKIFGRSRPATGFSTDLKTLVALGHYHLPELTPAIYVQESQDNRLSDMVVALRQQGERVILGDEVAAAEVVKPLGCDRFIQYKNDQWVVVRVMDNEQRA